MSKSKPTKSELQNFRLKECPVCGKKGSGPHWKLVYNKVHMGYVYPYFAHYVGTRGTTRIIEWCYIGKRRLIEAYQKDQAANSKDDESAASNPESKT